MHHSSRTCARRQQVQERRHGQQRPAEIRRSHAASLFLASASSPNRRNVPHAGQISDCRPRSPITTRASTTYASPSQTASTCRHRSALQVIDARSGIGMVPPIASISSCDVDEPGDLHAWGLMPGRPVHHARSADSETCGRCSPAHSRGACTRRVPRSAQHLSQIPT